MFLDRDGVINRSEVRDGRPYAPILLRDVLFTPGAGEALGRLWRAQYRLIVVTNQPDVARGVQRREDVDAIHERIRRAFPIDAIKVCFHTDADGCACRKPKPGMLVEAAREWSLELGACFMVGDRWRDIEAGRAAGCRTILIGNGYGEHLPSPPDAMADSLLDASRRILSRTTRRGSWEGR